jgi:transposase
MTVALETIGEHVVGVDPHKHTLTASVVDVRGGVVATATFTVSGNGHRDLESWALASGPVVRWGIEGASGLGRHTAAFLALRGHDVRDVCPNRTNDRARRRREGKTDKLDSIRIAKETLEEANLPVAFKRAGGEVGPDRDREQLALLHKARKSLLKSRQHLLNEAESLLVELPLEIREQLPDVTDVRPRLRALARLEPMADDPVDELRLELLATHTTDIERLDAREKGLVEKIRNAIKAVGSTLDGLVGLSDRSVAELLVETGDPRRFTEGGYARFNGTAPIPVSSAEGDGDPARHRLNRGGNRRLNAVLHRMAVTQLRCEPRARQIYDGARQRGHTKKEAMRILKRHLSNVVWKHMDRDLSRRRTIEAPAQDQAA